MERNMAFFTQPLTQSQIDGKIIKRFQMDMPDEIGLKIEFDIFSI